MIRSASPFLSVLVLVTAALCPGSSWSQFADSDLKDIDVLGPLIDAERYGDAEATGTELLAQAIASDGADSARAYFLKGVLGELHYKQEEFAKVIEYLEDALPYIREKIGPQGDFPNRLTEYLAQSHEAEGNFTRSREYHETLLKTYVELFGYDNDLVKATIVNMARVRTAEKIAKGEPVASGSAAISESQGKELGALVKRAESLVNAGNYSDAIDPATEAYEMAREFAGVPVSARWATADFLGRSYYGVGRVDEATTHLREAVGLESKVRHLPEVPAPRMILYRLRLAVCLVLTDQSEEAAELLTELVNRIPDAGDAISNADGSAITVILTVAQHAGFKKGGSRFTGFYRESADNMEKIFLPALHRVFGRDAPAGRIVEALSAEARMRSGTQDRARVLYTESLALDLTSISKAVATPEGFRFLDLLRMPGEGQLDWDTAAASGKDQYGEDLRSAPLGEEVVERAVAFWGPAAPLTVRKRLDLASRWSARGNPGNSASLVGENISAIAEILGTGSTTLINPLIQKSRYETASGQTVEALESLERALAIAEGSDDPELLAKMHGQLVEFHSLAGDRVRAKYHVGEFLSLEKETTPADLQTLLALMTIRGIPKEAIIEKLREFRKKFPDQFSASDLAMVEDMAPSDSDRSIGQRFDQIAQQLLAEAEKADPGEARFMRARALRMIGIARIDQGRPIEALEFFNKADETGVDIQGGGAGTNFHLGYHALALVAAGQHEEAVNKARSAHAQNKKRWELRLRLASGEGRSQFADLLNDFNLCGTVKDGELAAEVLVWRKGALLESLIEDRAVALSADHDPEIKALLTKIEDAKNELHQREISASTGGGGTEKAKLLESIVTLESELARKVGIANPARRSLGVSISDVRESLGDGEILVDFFRYLHFTGTKKGAGIKYAAVATARGDRKSVFVDLGDARLIDDAIGRHRDIAATPHHPGKSSAEIDSSLEDVSRQLHDLLIEPVLSVAPPSTDALVLCPDHKLQFLAFGSLLGADGEFLAQHFRLRHVSSARDLVARERFGETKKAIRFIADPDYPNPAPRSGLETEPKATEGLVASALTEGTRASGLGSIKLGQLPGTRVEVEQLSELFVEAGWKTETRMDEGASERFLLESPGNPGILHLATHGFFLGGGEGGENQGASIGQTRVVDPMLRGALAMSGAQTTLNLWADGEVPPLRNDGLLTAAEAATLPLQFTELVTLSACDTALGDSTGSEGVVGLRTGFAMAGARNLLLTLWEIHDQDTVDFMNDFYRRYLAGQDPTEAMEVTQREFLTRLREEHGLWYAVNRAGPFVLTSSGGSR